MKLKLLSTTLLLVSSLVSAQSFVYITDQVDIPMRAEKTFGDNIVRSLSSGSKLAILQATEDGWTQVKFEGSTGWIISRYLSNNPPARAQLEKLRQTYNANKLLINKLAKRKNELETEVQSLKVENTKLSIQTNKSVAEKQHVEKVYKDALKLEHSNDKLITTNLQLQAEIQLLKNNKTAAQDSSFRNWFITGSFVLFFGILIGFIFPNFVNRRRY
ncbi:TIGR04211 family SH3 domain-containing protein [Candidatus Thioglobus sp.]|jgi:SH3 domain protein|uniref:TIGR04211 family SH3 domain-containing protein n=1 Tax=Candidatus Thioglobus sp. TaxID=2026721 RepID=UPI001D36D078|nr:TIGR04211 family SH3 domain-containing protein [Candidatus Thioglobus sp.]MBT3276696.1 TIGR04211 family SH3 domain-containing protein [Candidatus Thioglobus sp.]MBT3745230.1 TIGR04211 family SH3 domain-containing protein [Candidatus Thioglobus sp.]MBT4001383.1 TIGR04211 family SH3 domain-containing protein [Candidatus Thioglobus sp.]MBT4181639.1 TIGR04211 family SH3 domain-containing protein [Candidatus Thioglobus sp.]MBT4421655.1 TIGR04211 family SH3 domain-containing protein [Candidatus T